MGKLLLMDSLGSRVSEVLSRRRRRLSSLECKWILQHVSMSPESCVLDIGTGPGFLASALSSENGLRVWGVDVQDIRQVKVPLCLFDGETFPFRNGCFDTVILSFVLHHTQRKKQILSECIRVANRWIVVFEDVADSWFDKLLFALHGYGYNTLYGIAEHPQTFSTDEWIEFFKLFLTTKLSIRTVPVGRLSFAWFFPIARRLFLLDLNPIGELTGMSDNRSVQ